MIECFQISLFVHYPFSPPPPLLLGQILKLYFKNYLAQGDVLARVCGEITFSVQSSTIQNLQLIIFELRTYTSD